MAKPGLRLVRVDGEPVAPRMDACTRESHIRMIHHLRRRYGLQILVDQATFGRDGVESLDDEALSTLHADLDRARECLAEGISLEDAGLIRSVGSYF